MADYKKFNKNFMESFGIEPPLFSRPNTRIGVRYIREDIAVAVCKIGLFNFGFRFNKEIVVELLDISSKGLLIGTDKKLRINQKITIFLKFENQRVFRRAAKVIRRAEGPPYRYGIQFDKLSNSLGDYLLETQKKLVFK
ncbi:PilZ domain-containing protein [Crenothrix polyspora]|uniref:PilZ domain-containing protein n=1 Tax=Crenothrix polyspora TaxID=360316 RepID=A0A1R4H2R0_9GAMM|nr:PilZ domain-containing protein [Crenothrix polyspora]SJM90340.1 PilZ domain-containing protein [Crenothrix polyspora]